MKTHLKQIMLMLTLVFTFASCSSDNDNDNENTPEPVSRDVKYEVTGNFTGIMDVSYLEKSGAPLIEDLNTLPWTKEFTADAGSDGALLHTSGYNGVAGQTLTAKIYVGGVVVSELTGTANNDGIIVVHTKTYVFPK